MRSVVWEPDKPDRGHQAEDELDGQPQRGGSGVGITDGRPAAELWESVGRCRPVGARCKNNTGMVSAPNFRIAIDFRFPYWLGCP